MEEEEEQRRAAARWDCEVSGPGRKEGVAAELGWLALARGTGPTRGNGPVSVRGLVAGLCVLFLWAKQGRPAGAAGLGRVQAEMAFGFCFAAGFGSGFGFGSRSGSRVGTWARVEGLGPS